MAVAVLYFSSFVFNCFNCWKFRSVNGKSIAYVSLYIHLITRITLYKHPKVSTSRFWSVWGENSFLHQSDWFVVFNDGYYLFTKCPWSSAPLYWMLTLCRCVRRQFFMQHRNSSTNRKCVFQLKTIYFLIWKLRKWSIYESIAAMCICVDMSCTLIVVFHVYFVSMYLCAYWGECWQWQFTRRAVEWRQNKVLLKIPVFLVWSQFIYSMFIKINALHSRQSASFMHPQLSPPNCMPTHLLICIQIRKCSRVAGYLPTPANWAAEDCPFDVHPSMHSTTIQHWIGS